MDSITVKLQLTHRVNAQNNILGTTTPMNFGSEGDKSLSFTFGTTSGKVNCHYFEQRELAAGANETLDLTVITTKPSNFYTTFGFATIKGIIIYMTANVDSSTPSSGIRVGNAATDAWEGWLSSGSTEDVDYAGMPYMKGSDAGKAVDATNKNLKITNLDGVNKATYRIWIVGVKV